MIGLKLSPTLDWPAVPVRLAIQHVALGISASAALALIHGIEDRGRR